MQRLIVKLHGIPMRVPSPTIEPHYTLKEAVARFFPGGALTVASLRTEIRKGRLLATKPAGKILVTESSIAEMLKSCVVDSRPTLSSKNAHARQASEKASRASAPFGSSETERIAEAQAAANMILKAPSKR